MLWANTRLRFTTSPAGPWLRGYDIQLFNRDTYTSTGPLATASNLTTSRLSPVALMLRRSSEGNVSVILL